MLGGCIAGDMAHDHPFMGHLAALVSTVGAGAEGWRVGTVVKVAADRTRLGTGTLASVMAPRRAGGSTRRVWSGRTEERPSGATSEQASAPEWEGRIGDGERDAPGDDILVEGAQMCACTLRPAQPGTSRRVARALGATRTMCTGPTWRSGRSRRRGKGRGQGHAAPVGRG
jgi:hypothetical protein